LRFWHIFWAFFKFLLGISKFFSFFLFLRLFHSFIKVLFHFLFTYKNFHYLTCLQVFKCFPIIIEKYFCVNSKLIFR
jgi:hypothetical protein